MMQINKQAKARLSLFFFAITLLFTAPVMAAPKTTVAYAGSMGAVMDDGLGPAFAKANDIQYRGIGHGSYGLAQMLKAKQRVADVFVPITPGPIKLLQKANFVEHATPVASTQMVIVYSPNSQFADDFEAAQKGKKNWYDVLRQDGVHFGRTDPATDPKGRNIIFTIKLAALYNNQPNLFKDILGEVTNSDQIFAETALLTRLEAGQIDAAASYEAEAISRGLPFIELADQVNLSNPNMWDDWYSKVSFNIKDKNSKDTKQTVQPLVYYAAVPKNAPSAERGQAFVNFMLSDKGQEIFKKFGYDAPKGDEI